MPETYVRARIEPGLKDNASNVLNDMGLTVSNAIRLFLMRVVSDKALPFDVKVPNAKTRASMKAAERGEVEYYENLDELL